MPGLDPYRGELEAALRRNEELAHDNALLRAELDAASAPQRAKTRRSLRFVGLGAAMFVAVAGVAVLAVPYDAGHLPGRVEGVRHDLQVLQQVTEQYRATNPSAPCPGMDELLRAGELGKASSRTDPWGQPYRILCSADRVVAISAGPDAQLGTADDIVGTAAPGK